MPAQLFDDALTQTPTASASRDPLSTDDDKYPLGSLFGVTGGSNPFHIQCPVVILAMMQQAFFVGATFGLK